MGKAAANEPTKIRFTPGSAKTESIVDRPAKESLEDALAGGDKAAALPVQVRTGAGDRAPATALGAAAAAPGKGDAAGSGAAAAAPGVSGLGAGDEPPC